MRAACPALAATCASAPTSCVKHASGQRPTLSSCAVRLHRPPRPRFQPHAHALPPATRRARGSNPRAHPSTREAPRACVLARMPNPRPEGSHTLPPASRRACVLACPYAATAPLPRSLTRRTRVCAILGQHVHIRAAACAILGLMRRTHACAARSRALLCKSTCPTRLTRACAAALSVGCRVPRQSVRGRVAPADH
eukprot:3297766-Prymnesium_polylepis.4